MNNFAIASIKSCREACVTTLLEEGVSMFLSEREMVKDNYLKKIVGAAALLVARLDRVSLPGGAAMAALTLAGLIESMPEDMVSEALSSYKSA